MTRPPFWERQLASMIDHAVIDNEAVADFGIAYYAETGDGSFFDMSFVELFSPYAQLLPTAISEGIHINRSASHSGKLSWAGLLGSDSCSHRYATNRSDSAHSNNHSWNRSASESGVHRLARSINFRGLERR